MPLERHTAFSTDAKKYHEKEKLVCHRGVEGDFESDFRTKQQPNRSPTNNKNEMAFGKRWHKQPKTQDNNQSKQPHRVKGG
jgi:hypothetical protein